MNENCPWRKSKDRAQLPGEATPGAADSKLASKTIALWATNRAI
jgi:hypothetical protein